VVSYADSAVEDQKPALRQALSDALEDAPKEGRNTPIRGVWRGAEKRVTACICHEDSAHDSARACSMPTSPGDCLQKRRSPGSAISCKKV
jgi:hypothetical protein